MTVLLVGFVLCFVLILHLNSVSLVHRSGSVLTAQSSAAIPKPEQASPGLPVRLEIPKINVDAAIESVGITAKGEMGVPKAPANAAWYNQGPRPGEKGNAVIDGHYGYKDNIPAVFDNLSKLRSGDKLYIQDGNGVTNTFVVRSSQSFVPSADASSVFRSSDGRAHLNLITCEGDWNPTQYSYSNRLVVFTDKE